MGNFLLWSKYPFRCCATLDNLKSCESNLQVWNLLQTPIIPWILQIFVKAIQVQLTKYVTKRMRHSIHKYGTTICYDGWDNIAWYPLLNVMFACPSGDVFIGSINIIGEQKDAYYICNVLVGYIKTIKVNNIVQICTNNVLNMKNAVDFIIHHFPSLYF